MALAWRLHRGSLAGQAVGFALVGLALGGIAGSLGELMTTSTPATRELLARMGGPGAIVDQFVAVLVELSGVVAAALAIQTVLVLRTQERDGHAEALLATPTDRLRWAGGHLAVALLGPTLLLAVFGAAFGLAHGLTTGDIGGQLPRVLQAALGQLPAVWLFAGLAFALFGLRPRVAVGAFAVLGASLLIRVLGFELQLDQWVRNLSVFEHVSRFAGGEVRMLPLVVLTALAAALVVAGLLGLRRRDLPIT